MSAMSFFGCPAADIWGGANVRSRAQTVAAAAAAAAAASLGLSNRALSACRTAAGRLAKLGPCSTYVRT